MSDDAAKFLAMYSIAATLGVEVADHDTGGRQGAYDLEYELGGRRVAVEVKQILDQDFMQASAESSKAPYVESELLTRCWHVWMRHDAQQEPARHALPALLARLEALGWPSGRRLFHLRAVDEQLYRDLTNLGVSSVSSGPVTTLHAAGFYVMPKGVGVWVPRIEQLPAHLEKWTTSNAADKLRGQLADAEGVDERHAFLVLGLHDPFTILLDRPGGPSSPMVLPTDQPALPEPIDGIWVTTSTPDAQSHPVRLVAWLPGRGWIEGTRALSQGQIK